MSRHSPFGHGFVLGFDDIERTFARAARPFGDGYPPYDIERLFRSGEEPERLRVTLAVAGFARHELEILLDESRLLVRGRQAEDKVRHFLHRDIAARQFQRTFLLAEGLDVTGAELSDGLLRIVLARPEPARIVRTVAIATTDGARAASRSLP